MTALPRTSLVIVSRHRTDTLLRCLAGVAQLQHPALEVVVVADPEALAAVAAQGLAVKRIACDIPNISLARNLGIRAAAGEVVAFLDDDAVPEPGWAAALSAPFATAQVAAAGGVVRARNGISWQWRAGRVDRLLREAPEPLPEGPVRLLHSAPGNAVEFKGVNCAYRRTLLCALGGFDPALRYYLDETELNLRLAARRALVARVPGAEVHHFKAASRQRDAARVPLSLEDVGRSTAVVLRRLGCTPAEIAEVRRETVLRERAKAIRHMVAGGLEPREVTRLIAGLEAAFDAALQEVLPRLDPLDSLPEAQEFLPFQALARPGRVLSGWRWQARRLRAEAAAAAASGQIVTLFLFDLSPRFHVMRYDAQGFWEQNGGLWGWSRRSGPRFRPWRFRARLQHEMRRLGGIRPGMLEMSQTRQTPLAEDGRVLPNVLQTQRLPAEDLVQETRRSH